MKAIRNFAIIATMASFVVACGGKKEGEATEATTDSAATEMPAEEVAPAATDSTSTTDSTTAPNPAEAPAAH